MMTAVVLGLILAAVAVLALSRVPGARLRLGRIFASVGRYFRQFSVLRTLKRDYWGIQIINFMDNLFAFAFGTVSTIFMSKTLGFSDVGAGVAISWLGIVTSVFLFASGFIVDRVGLRKSLLVSICFVILMRTGMALCAFWPFIPGHDAVFQWFVALAGGGSTGFGRWIADVAWRQWLYLTCMAMGGLPLAVKNTAYHIGNKRYTTKNTQGAGFNVWYIIMNVSAFAAGFLVDGMRDMRLHYGWFVVLGIATGVITLLTTWLLIRPDEEALADLAEPDDATADQPDNKIRTDVRGWFKEMKSVVRHPSFWRMLAAVTLNLGVSAVFLYWVYISPKYWDRAIGPGAAIGKLSAINPFVIIVGLFLLVPVIDRFKTFTLLTWGSFIAAGSLLPLTIPWTWVSADPVKAYYLTNIVSMVVFSFGELMFSPRLSQYILAVAPAGQEGVYSSFAALPTFVRKTVVGFISGVMLARWCPETRVMDGAARPLHEVIASRTLPYWDTPEAMWLILFLVAIIGPLIMLPLRKWFLSGMADKKQAVD